MSKLSAKPFTCPRGKSLLEICRLLFFETQICPGPIATNVCVSAVAGIGGLSNGAKRNAKADQLRPVPRHNLNKETESNEDTEPRHCRNILLAAGHYRFLLSLRSTQLRKSNVTLSQ